jgi:hypothetical protein
MLVENLKLICRIYKIIKIFNYPIGIVEVLGICRLTNKMVIRYVSSDRQVFEFDEKTELWVPLSEGVCKNHFNHFASVVLPIYENNVIEYRKAPPDACN